jgi:hypothetical protein
MQYIFLFCREKIEQSAKRYSSRKFYERVGRVSTRRRNLNPCKETASRRFSQILADFKGLDVICVHLRKSAAKKL